MAQITWRNINNETTDASSAYFRLADVLANMGTGLSKAVGNFDDTRKANTQNFVTARAAMANTPEQLNAERTALLGNLPSNLLTKDAIAAFGSRQQELDTAATSELNRVLANNRDKREDTQLGIQQGQFNLEKDRFDYSKAESERNFNENVRQFSLGYDLNVDQFNEGKRQFGVNSDRADKALDMQDSQFQAGHKLNLNQFDETVSQNRLNNALERDKLNQVIASSNDQLELSRNKDAREGEVHKLAVAQAGVNQKDSKALADFNYALANTTTYAEGESVARNFINSGVSSGAALQMQQGLNSKYQVPDLAQPIGTASLDSALAAPDSGMPAGIINHYGDLNPAFNNIPVKTGGVAKSMGEVFASGSSEFNNGGAAGLGTQALVTGVASVLGSNLKWVSAGNDAYHQDKSKVPYTSGHQSGGAIDVVVNNGDWDGSVKQIKDSLTSQGFEPKDYNVHYAGKGRGASNGDHIHVELKASGKAKMEATVKAQVAAFQANPSSKSSKNTANEFVDTTRLISELSNEAKNAESLVTSRLPPVQALKAALPNGGTLGAYSVAAINQLDNLMDDGDKKSKAAKLNVLAQDVEANLIAQGYRVDPANIVAGLMHTAKSNTSVWRYFNTMGASWGDMSFDTKGAKEEAIKLQLGHYDKALDSVSSYNTSVTGLAERGKQLEALTESLRKTKAAANAGVQGADTKWREGVKHFDALLAETNKLASAISKQRPKDLEENAKNNTRIADQEAKLRAEAEGQKRKYEESKYRPIGNDSVPDWSVLFGN